MKKLEIFDDGGCFWTAGIFVPSGYGSMFLGFRTIFKPPESDTRIPVNEVPVPAVPVRYRTKRRDSIIIETLQLILLLIISTLPKVKYFL